MSENDRRGSQKRIILRGFKPSLKQVVGGRGWRHALSPSQRMDLFECANDIKLEGFVSLVVFHVVTAPPSLSGRHMRPCSGVNLAVCNVAFCYL